MSDEERLEYGGEFYEWEREPDLTSISEEELKARLKEFDEEERTLSYRRRVLQGRIDLIRAELVRRGGVVLSPADLARVLMGGEDTRSGRLDREGGGS
jgi:hypothetical protein